MVVCGVLIATFTSYPIPHPLTKIFTFSLIFPINSPNLPKITTLLQNSPPPQKLTTPPKTHHPPSKLTTPPKTHHHPQNSPPPSKLTPFKTQPPKLTPPKTHPPKTHPLKTHHSQKFHQTSSPTNLHHSGPCHRRCRCQSLGLPVWPEAS